MLAAPVPFFIRPPRNTGVFCALRPPPSSLLRLSAHLKRHNNLRNQHRPPPRNRLPPPLLWGASLWGVEGFRTAAVCDDEGSRARIPGVHWQEVVVVALDASAGDAADAVGRPPHAASPRHLLAPPLHDRVSRAEGCCRGAAPGGRACRDQESKEECEYLIELAKPHLEKSTVVDSTTGKSKDSRVRTSSGMFLERGRDKVIQAIEKRIADFTFVPIEHGEGLQILHYEVGQKYEPHYDYFLDEFNTKNGGQQIATVLMYLSDVEEGGETVFPAVTVNSSSSPYSNELSECGRKGLAVKPNMGDALLFWSMRPDATLDPSSLHGGCPVIKGNKWSSTKWLHIHEYKI